MSQTVSENAKFRVSTLKKEKKQRLNPVSEFMVQGIEGLSPFDDLSQAALQILTQNSNGLPVLNMQKEVIGFLSEKECLKHAYDSKYNALPQMQVQDFMITEAYSIDEKMDIYTAIDLFINFNYQCYPVTREGRFVGILYRTNALKAVTQLEDYYF